MKLAIILFNLGGPDRPEAVQPFLFNLFNDPAIIGAPGPIRWLLAKLISGRRAPVAREIYGKIGGRSPILPNTEAQARALEQSLSGLDLGTGTPATVRCFITMRYWHPRAAETVAEVKRYAPDRVLLLPLYPQYSTTTSASSLKEWRLEAERQDLTVDTQTLCCYPRDAGFAEAMADLIHPLLAEAAAKAPPGKAPRLLLSAHGLPQKVVDGGDPYQWQVEQSAARVVQALNQPGLDAAVCYQSRVGPLKWIGPSTEDELKRAARDGVPVIICPVAFVSDHSETLVEIELEYRELAHELGIPGFYRVPAVGDHPRFIQGLADTVRTRLTQPERLRSNEGGSLCPGAFSKCPHRLETAHA